MDNKIVIRGKVCHIGEVETVGANGFVKRTFVIKDENEMSRFPKILAFTLKKDNCGLIDSSFKGQIVDVTAYVESRDWEDPKTGTLKFFTDVTAVGIQRVSYPNPGEEYNPPDVKPLTTAPSPEPKSRPAMPPPPSTGAGEDDVENLPF